MPIGLFDMITNVAVVLGCNGFDVAMAQLKKAILSMALLLPVAAICAEPTHTDNYILINGQNKTRVLMGFLIADRTDDFVKLKQARVISGAMTLAVERINKNPSILPRHHLEFIWSDTNADTLKGTKALTHQWRRGAAAFFGPEDSCDVEARVAAAWNLPMISYVSICAMSVSVVRGDWSGNVGWNWSHVLYNWWIADAIELPTDPMAFLNITCDMHSIINHLYFHGRPSPILTLPYENQK